MPWTEAQVPLIDPLTGRFPDRFAPPSVASDTSDAEAAAAAALVSQGAAAASAVTATTQAGTATTQAGIATTQAGIATTQAGSAASAKLAAEAAQGGAVVAAGAASDSAVAANADADAASGSAAAALGYAGDAEGWRDAAALLLADASAIGITIGTVTTVEGGGSATAGITGVTPDLTLNLGIPRGDVGSVTTATTTTLTGIIAGSGTNIVTGRTLTGTASQITVTNGTGASGNPTISIPSGLAVTAPVFSPTTAATTYGTELAPAIDTWTGAAGAAWSSPNWNIPSGGTIAATIAVTTGDTYQIEMTRTGSSGGLMAVSLGAATTSIPADGNAKLTLTAAATGGVALTIGGGTWVCTTISAVTVKKVTAFVTAGHTSAGTAVRTAGDSLAIGSGMAKSTTGTSNTSVGYEANLVIGTGTGNTSVGASSGKAVSSGDSNTFIGYLAGRNVTTGSSNTHLGQQSGYLLTTGGRNVCLGVFSGYSLTTGSYNSFNGVAAGRSVTTGSYNMHLGASAGYTDGTTATVADVVNTVAMGKNAQATVSNVAVIGSAITADRQTLCLGNYNALGSDVRGGFALANASTAPTTNPTGGGILYAEAGALKWRGSSGTVTTIGPA